VKELKEDNRKKTKENKNREWIEKKKQETEDMKTSTLEFFRKIIIPQN
jgi:hypothetical protein